jgi:hypothetical protein
MMKTKLNVCISLTENPSVCGDEWQKAFHNCRPLSLLKIMMCGGVAGSCRVLQKVMRDFCFLKC